MVEITNRSLGPRVLWIKGSTDAPVARTLARGETADVELFRSVDSDPVLKTWVDDGEIIIGPVPGAPGQPSMEELMAAWNEKQAREAGPAAPQLAPQGIGQQLSGADTSQQSSGTGETSAPNFDTMSDDDLRAFLMAREVMPGNWQRPRLLREADTVKDVPPTKAA